MPYLAYVKPRFAAGKYCWNILTILESPAEIAIPATQNQRLLTAPFQPRWPCLQFFERGSVLEWSMWWMC